MEHKINFYQLMILFNNVGMLTIIKINQKVRYYS